MTRKTSLLVSAAMFWLAAGCVSGAENGEIGLRVVAGEGFVVDQAYRLVDTRESAAFKAGETKCWQVGGKNGTPASATAVSVNLTAVEPTGNGFLTAFPFTKGSKAVPVVSNLNFSAGQTIANGAVVALGDEGKICVYSLVATNVVVDVSGHFSSAAHYKPVAPFRRADTREPEDDILRADKTRCWKVAGRDGIAGNATAVAVNLTAVRPGSNGFITAFPFKKGSSSVPETSSLNYRKDGVAANGAIVAVGDEGKICVYSLAKTDFVLDVAGFFPATSSYVPLAPSRLMDTRPKSFPLAGSSRCVTVSGKGGVPADARAIAINLTVVNPTDRGFLLARPRGRTRVDVSSINFAAGDTRANNVIVKPGVDGKICVFASANADYVIDVMGYFQGHAPPSSVAHPHTFNVKNRVQFTDALEQAAAGDLIKLGTTSTIDLTGLKELYIRGGVTIDGGRKWGTPGALIRTLDQSGAVPVWSTWNLLRTAGDKVVVKNLRLQGPDGSHHAGRMASGLLISHNNCLVQGTELFHWPARAVSTSGSSNAIVETSYIHHNLRTGRGYGVVVGTTDSATIIRDNWFEQNRHSIAGNGYGSYEVYNNRFMQSSNLGMHYIIDMHGANEHKLDNSTQQAGVDIHIHHNDFEFTGAIPGFVGIRGVPKNEAIIENNCVSSNSVTWVTQANMIAFDAAQPGMSCYEKGSVWLCHNAVHGANMQNITLRNNFMGTPSGCIQ